MFQDKYKKQIEDVVVNYEENLKKTLKSAELFVYEDNDYKSVSKEIKIKEVSHKVDYMFRDTYNNKLKSREFGELEMINGVSLHPMMYLSARITLTIKYKIKGKKKNEIADDEDYGDNGESTTEMEAKINCLPNCCGVAVISDLKCIGNRLKLGTSYFQLMKDIAKANGYSVVIMTDKSNGNGYKILQKDEKVNKVIDFVNSRSKNKVGIFIEVFDTVEEKSSPVEEFSISETLLSL